LGSAAAHGTDTVKTSPATIHPRMKAPPTQVRSHGRNPNI